MSMLDEALREAIHDVVTDAVREVLAEAGVQLEQPNTEAPLRPAEAAELLGVHRNTVYALIDAGDLPAERHGRALVIRRRDVYRLIEANRLAAAGGGARQ